MKSSIFWRSMTFPFFTFCLGLHLLIPLASAQDAETSPGINAKWLFSHDTDDFDEARIFLGYQYANGFGLGATVTHYSAPDWSASGQGIAGTYAQRNAARDIDAALGVMRTEGHQTLTANLDYLERIAENTALGVSIERDVVNSVRSIDEGIDYMALMLVLDHNFTRNFNVGVAAGNTWFSDNNRRPILRTRWNYELIPDSGLNLYVKTRHYENSRPYQGNYYAPDKLGEASLGFSWRAAINDDVVFFLSADGGRQRVDSDARYSIWGALAGLQSHRRSPVRWRVALEITNNAASMFSQASDAYRYMSLSGYLFIPLR